MTLLRVDRSPVRLFLLGLVGLFLMLGAVDIMWGHWIATPPDRYNDEITSKGRNQRRADYAWGAFLMVGGGGLFGYAVTSLNRRSPVLVLREDGVVLTVGAPGEEPVFLPWSEIEAVSSASIADPDGGYDRDALVLDVLNPAGLPSEPWGAEWVGNRLVVDADGWETPIGEVVIHAEIAMEHAHNFPEPVAPALEPAPSPAALVASASEVAATEESPPDPADTEPMAADPDDPPADTDASFEPDLDPDPDPEEITDD